MPRKAWIEIHDEAGALLATCPSEIDGGTIRTRLPKFEPGARGTLTMCEVEPDGTVFRVRDDPQELLSTETVLIVETG